MDLKKLERTTFRSTYVDGLLDIDLGMIIVCMAFFLHRSEDGFGPRNDFLMLISFLVGYAVFWAGKKFITLPRLGQVIFGEQRKKKTRTLAILMGLVIALQVGFVLLSVLARKNPELGSWIDALLPGNISDRLLVAAVSALFVGPPMMLVAYFTDFMRGFYIAILMSLTVFLMILFDQPIYAVMLGVLVIIPGVVLFVRFLKKYPKVDAEVTDEGNR